MLTDARWRKIFRDLWGNKTRTVLVVLSIAIGVLAIGVLANTQAMLNHELAADFMATNPASAILTTDRPFDQKLVDSIQKLPEVQAAQGRFDTNVRLLGAENEWTTMDLFVVDDFDDIRVNKIWPQSGAWPPAKGEILLERSFADLPALANTQVGDVLTVKTSGAGTRERFRELRLAGTVLDLSLTPSMGTGRAYAYLTFDTLELLGMPRRYNQLRLVVAGDRFDEDYIQEVVGVVENKIEKTGRIVENREIPDPGEHPLAPFIDAILYLLGGLGAFSLLASAFLVVNTISALLTQQIRQVGIMKAIGARPGQIMQIYWGMALAFGLLALLTSIPLAMAGANMFTVSLGNAFNFDIDNFTVPFNVLALEVALGLAVPFVAGFYPVFVGARITAQQAFSSYGLGKGQFGAGKFDRLLQRVSTWNQTVMLALRNMFRRRGRLILTLVALTLSGAIFMSAFSVRTSLYQVLDRWYGGRQDSVQIFLKQPYRTQKIEQTVLNVPGVARMESFGFSPSIRRVRPNRTESMGFNMVGMSPNSQMVQLTMAEGRRLLPEDGRAAVINGDLLREEPGLNVGDDVVFKIEGREETLRIVGIAAEIMAAPTVYVNEAFFTGAVVRETGRTRGLWVTANQRDTAFEADVAKSLELEFASANLGIFNADTLSERRAFIAFHIEILTGALLVMTFLLAVVGGLGLTGTMNINIMERTREIGVMRAIGASNRSIRRLVVTEGVFIGLLSWLTASLVAAPIGYMLTQAVAGLLRMQVQYQFSIGSIALWLVLGLGLAVLASLAPARTAINLTVREVLAYE
jgi:putative ABC transport system permease protein